MRALRFKLKPRDLKDVPVARAGNRRRHLAQCAKHRSY